ncbi:MAG: type II toxin-antitoxin system YafQ family toxin [Streptococcaceae bacterium]|jgi:mRNA interferase YafQ|nr:type II toxin-antitoxin system YafQ family toxin [Streptococcaceae bacterium]
MTTVRQTPRFKRHLKILPERLRITQEEAKIAVEEIISAIEILEGHGTLPEELGYQLHNLEDAPWKGYLEFHALDDVLVIYAEVTKKNLIKLRGIYNHELLNSGKLD